MTLGGNAYGGITESRNGNYVATPGMLVLGASAHRKFSTRSGSKREVASSTDMHELLKCPICMNVMHPPIHQSKVRCCPVCHNEVRNIRGLALEKVAESLELPCRYQVLGCQDIFPYDSRLRHEKNCWFRPYNCPYSGAECLVSGDILFLVAHLNSDHKVDMQNGSTFNHRYVKSDPQDFEYARWMLTIFNCYGHQFCLHFEAFNLGTAPVYMAFIRFMGKDHDARKFSYSLEVGANGRKLTWQGVPRSIRDCHSHVRNSMDGLIIHRSMALFFSGGNSRELSLRVAGRIWKEQP